MNSTSAAESRAASRRAYALGLGVFIRIVGGGLDYVKWSPSYSKALDAAVSHSIGTSILSRGATPPAPSFQAAWDYTVAYTLAIWKALILGLLLGSAVQSLIRRESIARLLGKMSFGSVAVAGAASIFSMM